ncbi:MAG: alpha/beta hydrolase fold domain-containing protein [Ilumatobacter sp.]|nr:alpha/beta hydrolase fold domain-containing protein [Ilumatobacter sp.]
MSLVAVVDREKGGNSFLVEAFEFSIPFDWSICTTEAAIRELPPTVIRFNGCDPLREDGIDFERLLLRVGVERHVAPVSGTIHGTESFVIICPIAAEKEATTLRSSARIPDVGQPVAPQPVA